MRKMHLLVAPVFLFIGLISAGKQGNFGIFTGCITKNKSLRLDCYYGFCPDSPVYTCEFMTSKGDVLAKLSSKNDCQYTLPDHPQRYHNETTSYNCTLTRREREEHKYIVINYNIKTRKDRIKDCPSTTGLLIHHLPVLLWPVVILSMWMVLNADGSKTT